MHATSIRLECFNKLTAFFIYFAVVVAVMVQNEEVWAQECTPTDPEWTTYLNSRIPGGIVIGTLTVRDCQSNCVRNLTCKGINFNRSATNNCQLILSRNTYKLQNSSSFTHYNLTGRGSICHCNPVWTIHNNLAIPNGLWMGRINTSECQAICISYLSCKGFDHNGNECWLTLNDGNMYPFVGVTHYTLSSRGLPICQCSLNDPVWTIHNNSAISGGHGLDGINTSECQAICISYLSCKGFDHNGNECWLTLNDGSMNPHDGVTHYTLSSRGLPICRTYSYYCRTATSALPTTPTTTTTTTTTSTTTTSTPTSVTSTTTTPTPTTTTAAPSTTTDRDRTTTGANPGEAEGSKTGISDQTKIIIGVVVGVVGGLVLVAIVIFFILRGRRNRRDTDKSTIQPSHVPMVDAEKTSVQDGPVKMENLQAYVDRLTQSKGFNSQFELLPKDDLSKATVGSRPGNRKRNRFKNVLPYDANRVILPVSGESSSADDYVNASYIKTPNCQNVVYIATQGPRMETLEDFWKMVWHEKIDRMAMIALTIENGKAKCHQYWPNETGSSTTYGNVTVALIECQNFTDYAKRTMEIQFNGSARRRVIQLQYLVWPDKSTPNELWSVLAFRRRIQVLQSTSATGGPLLVHCSAGVGRTGTFMALDTLLRDAEKTGEVDVFGVVQHIRRERMSCVQVKEQYELIYRLLLDAYKSGNTVTPKRDVHSMYHVTNNACSDKLKREYEVLTGLKLDVPNVDELDALKPLNLPKNRTTDTGTLPPDHSRVYVMPSSSSGSDYINAVYVKGYSKPACYVLTQLPLQNTVCDFWRMILAERCTTVVLLDQIVSDQTTTAEFWPKTISELPTNFGSAAVKLLSSKPGNTDGSILIHTFRVTGRYTKTPVELEVRINELTTWTSGRETPDNVDSFLELNHLVADWERQQTPEPTTPETSRQRAVTVMCLDGATRSGLFVATSLAVDRLHWDEELDVFLSFRCVTAVRPKAVTSLDQYLFAHRVAARSLTWKPETVRCADAVYANIAGDNVEPVVYQNSVDIAQQMAGMQSTENDPASLSPGEDNGNVYENYKNVRL